jgi:hypothetical protein
MRCIRARSASSASRARASAAGGMSFIMLIFRRDMVLVFF